MLASTAGRSGTNRCCSVFCFTQLSNSADVQQPASCRRSSQRSSVTLSSGAFTLGLLRILVRSCDKICGESQPCVASAQKCSRIHSGNSSLCNGDGSSTVPRSIGVLSLRNRTGGG